MNSYLSKTTGVFVDIFNYKDYRKFLKDWLEKAKKDKNFSAKKVADLIGVHPTFLSQVLLDRKDFSAEHWMELCSHFDLTEIEKEFLHFTFLLNRSGNNVTKKFYQKKINEILTKRLQLKERLKDFSQLNDSDRAIFYSSWIYSAVRLFCSVDDGQTIESLAEKFDLNRDQIQSILDFLVQKGLCRQNGDRITMGDAHIHVPSGSPFVNKHHINWRVRALQSLDKSIAEDVHFTAPMAISKNDFSALREKIVKLIQESVEIAKQSPAEDLAAMTIDFFWPMSKS